MKLFLRWSSALAFLLIGMLIGCSENTEVNTKHQPIFNKHISIFNEGNSYQVTDKGTISIVGKEVNLIGVNLPENKVKDFKSELNIENLEEKNIFQIVLYTNEINKSERISKSDIVGFSLYFTNSNGLFHKFYKLVNDKFIVDKESLLSKC